MWIVNFSKGSKIGGYKSWYVGLSKSKEVTNPPPPKIALNSGRGGNQNLISKLNTLDL